MTTRTHPYQSISDKASAKEYWPITYKTGSNDAPAPCCRAFAAAAATASVICRIEIGIAKFVRQTWGAGNKVS
jgi:hypothetical protein